MEYLITFPSTNHAIKGESLLIKEGLGVTVMPLPPQIRAGCGICLRVREDEMESAVNVLTKNKLKEIKLYTRAGDEVIMEHKKLSLRLDNCTSGGCGAKIGPGELSQLLDGLPSFNDQRLLVGYASNDDGAVYKIDEEKSIVMTVDFFSPMIEDCRTFGRIAAANALSDIYAMGGRPITALNLVCFPESSDISLLGEIMRGGAEKVAEAGAVLAGGHSIYDKEPKYGLAVTGIVQNDKIIRNNTPEINHKLILTKPLGVGIIMAAHRAGAASGAAMEKAVASMERLNRYAAEKMNDYNVSACTDITGFGLLVHMIEMAGERVSFEVDYKELPCIQEAYQYAEEFLLTAAGQRNRNHAEGKINVDWAPFPIQELMFDPQTSGGLLICVSEGDAEGLLSAIQKDDPCAKIIGRVVAQEKDVILF